ncbi:MAG: response regulator transcription factor [Lachnospiraceae bacterium]|nr:response regulator transcription factor [Lachnospiraceae bacterium]
MEKILIIEDDVNINNLIREALGKQGYECTQAFSGSEALLVFNTQPYDLVILDLMLPGVTGEEVLGEIRKSKNIPVIVVSAKDELDAKVDLLSMGADDYLTKPFEIKELEARVQVWLRRTKSVPSGVNNVITHGEVVLNRENYEVKVNDTPVSFTRQEFKILELLLTHPNKVFTKQDIYDYAWEEYYAGVDKTINVHISNIRSKIKKYSDKEYIETVWGIGFKAANK